MKKEMRRQKKRSRVVAVLVPGLFCLTARAREEKEIELRTCVEAASVVFIARSESKKRETRNVSLLSVKKKKKKWEKAKIEINVVGLIFFSTHSLSSPLAPLNTLSAIKNRDLSSPSK